MSLSRFKKLLTTLFLATIIATLLASDALACPTCKQGMSGEDAVSVARATGYFYSILFMMAMPFVIVGTFGGAAYLSIRRAQAQKAKAPTLTDPQPPAA